MDGVPPSHRDPHRSRPDVDAVIVAHNAGDLLAAAVASAADEVGEERVWVMDAESVDGAPQRLSSSFPSSHVVPVPNRGFSASNNRGIDLTSGEWVLLLNPDAELQAGAVAVMLAAAEARETAGQRVGIVGPLVINPEGSPRPTPTGASPRCSHNSRCGHGACGRDSAGIRVYRRGCLPTRCPWTG